MYSLPTKLIKQCGQISNRRGNQQGSGNMILYKYLGHNMIFSLFSPLLLFHLHWTSVIIFLAHSAWGYLSNRNLISPIRMLWNVVNLNFQKLLEKIVTNMSDGVRVTWYRELTPHNVYSPSSTPFPSILRSPGLANPDTEPMTCDIPQTTGYSTLMSPLKSVWLL